MISDNVVLVMGKGGVGKTTISIVLSLILSSLGNTLLYSLDPAKHLIKYLGICNAMEYCRVSKTLTAYQLDISKAVSTAVNHYVSLIRDLTPSLSVLNIEDVLNVIKYSPGVEEEVFMKELKKLYDLREYKYVVIDTPPTGVTLRTLIMPKMYRVWLDKLIEVRERILSLRYTIARTLGKEFKVRDPALEKLYELRAEYSSLWDELRGEKTSYVLVTNPEVMPLLEVVDVIKFLEKELGVKPKLLVMNKFEDTLETSELLKEFNSLPYDKLLIPKVGKPPSTLDDMVELSRTINKDYIMKLFKS